MNSYQHSIVRPSPMSAQYYRFERPEVVRMVPESARTILDIGCAAGMVGASLKHRQPCHVTGIEIVPEAAAAAVEHLDEAHCGDAFEVLPALPAGHYDAVIMGDVLEHVADTDGLLRLAADRLTSSGRLILCIPNVRHWSVLKGLLEGEWEYQDLGILDRTHLRFFTHNSLHRILARQGFLVERASHVEFGEPMPPLLGQRLQGCGIAIGNLEEEARHHQYLFACIRETAAVPTAGNDADQARYCFNLAQSYRDLNQGRNSLSAYQRRIALGGAPDQVWYALYQSARLSESLGLERAVIVERYLQAYQNQPARAEPLHHLARLHREHKQYALAHLFARRGMAIPMPADALFVEDDCYGWQLQDEYSIASYWVGDYRTSETICRRLLEEGRLPLQQRARVIDNLNWALRQQGLPEYKQ